MTMKFNSENLLFEDDNDSTSKALDERQVVQAILPLENLGEQRIERRSKNEKLALSSANIYMDKATIRDADYIHSVLCQVGLPRKQPFQLNEEGGKILDEKGNPILAREFERRSGNSSLLIKAGECWDGLNWVKQPLPYGTIPRLSLVYIISEALRKKDPVINIGETLTDFMLSIGVSKSGGKYGRYDYVKKQIRALSVCELKLGVSSAMDARSITINPISEFRAWLSDSNAQKVLWPGEITLSKQFFDSIITHSVPLDKRALRELGDSALALDIYFWLAHRLHRSKRDGELIRWPALRSQFGQEYKNLFHFKEEFSQKLRQALTQYVTAKVKIDNSQGIIIYESPSPVPKKIDFSGK